MKKSFLTILTVSTALSFNALADMPSCGENCTYTIENGILTIQPIDETKPASVRAYNRDCEGGCHTDAPWSGQDVTAINIKQGITSVGDHAFENLPSVTSLELSEGLTTIGAEAFHGTAIKSVDFPSTLTSLGNFSFCIGDLEEVNGLSENLTNLGKLTFGYAKIKDLIIPANVTNFSTNIFGGHEDRGWSANQMEHLYCPESLASQCAAAIAYRGDDAEVKTYQYENGVYILQDENGDDKYYLSADNMKRADRAETDEEKAQYICADLDSCKASVLKNRGICADLNGDCKDFVSSANAGRMLKVGSKTYQSLDALLKGDFDRRRIYTVDEANFVAGKKNKVIIRYK